MCAVDLLSIVVPCYNEEQTLPAFWKEASAAVARLPEDVSVEYLFVDDGSRDGTLRVLKDMAAKAPEVRWLSFSRNFGKEAALYAGLEHAKGNYITVMDVDLQDPPSLLPELLEIVRSGAADCAAVS